MRTEHDFLGKKEIPKQALYGIHSLRAKENFPANSRFSKTWYQAVADVKLSVYQTYKRFKKALQAGYDLQKLPIELIDDRLLDAMIDSAKKMATGAYFDQLIVPAIQGGAGTSINMNVNEIIANLSLQSLGFQLGDYQQVSPFEHANIYQSTNDVMPTALTLAAMRLLNRLEEKINVLRFDVEKLESRYRNHLRIAYTQMQQAVPSSYGKLFSTYNEALSRDWWRISKCFERIKVVNLGGSAVGTGMAVPRYFVMEVVSTLKKLTQLPITRSENLSDATANLDTYVEIHGILKAHAVNLEKIASDLRLLASDLSPKEVKLPDNQVGSSIMPEKINPVIVEFVVSVAHKVYANDQIISSLAALGTLDLNAYLPTIGHALLESINLLISANQSIKTKLIAGLEINSKLAENELFRSPAITTALLPYLGYKQASLLAKKMKTEQLTIFEANSKLQLIDGKKLQKILKAENLLKTGFSIQDIL